MTGPVRRGAVDAPDFVGFRSGVAAGLVSAVRAPGAFAFFTAGAAPDGFAGRLDVGAAGAGFATGFAVVFAGALGALLAAGVLLALAFPGMLFFAADFVATGLRAADFFFTDFCAAPFFTTAFAPRFAAADFDDFRAGVFAADAFAVFRPVFLAALGLISLSSFGLWRGTMLAHVGTLSIKPWLYRS